MIQLVYEQTGGDGVTRKYELKVKEYLETQSLIQYSQLKEMNISSSQIDIMLNKGLLKRVSRGVYTLPHIKDDPYLELQSRYKQIIYSHETALRLHNMIDVIPEEITVTVPRTYNYQYLVKEVGLNAKRSIINRYTIGIMEVISPYGNSIRVYNKERTLCDIISKRNKTDLKTIHEAFTKYFSNKDMNLKRLVEYSKEFKVEKEVLQYMDVFI